jgi:hypothetical protein
VLFAVGGEGGKILCDGVVEGQLVLFIELHDCDCGDEALRERGHIEEGVLGHGLGCGGFAIEAGFAVELAVAVGVLEDDMTGVTDDYNSAGKFFGGDSVVD